MSAARPLRVTRLLVLRPIPGLLAAGLALLSRLRNVAAVLPAILRLPLIAARPLVALILLSS